MNDSYMKGTWTGTYQYQLKSNSELNKWETGFVLTITEFDGINFKGKVIDDLDTGGTKGEGKNLLPIKSIKILEKWNI
jgi:hypothetical protein